MNDLIKAVSMQVVGTNILILYSSGEIINHEIGTSKETQLRLPDEQTQIVGMCKDCKKPVYEIQEYNFSEREKWFQHAVEEDCDMSDQTVGACVPPEKGN